MGTVLYLDAEQKPSGQPMKVPGICRYCATRGWQVATVYREPDHPRSLRERLPALLASHKPVGCIVESCWGDSLLPPSLFAGIPVVYIDYQGRPSLRRHGAGVVVCDNEAAVNMAFRELSVGLPPCYAAIPGVRMAPWSGIRIRHFRALCRKAGKPCHVFPGRRGESRAERCERLGVWVKTLPRSCAIFGANDLAACDAVRALAANGLSVPRDATVVGIDGRNPALDPLEEQVTTIRLDFEHAGHLAARMLGEPEAFPSERQVFGPLMALRRKSTTGRGRREPRIAEAVAMIRAEACAGLTAAVLAARFRGNRNHFEQRFREATGHSVLDEILHVRLEGVLSYLARRDMPISAIAAFCGFGSDIELRRLFRRRFGTSMRQWRKEHAR